MEGFGLLSSPTKRELSEKELEAESALLMLLSRSDDASRPVENGMHRINHYGERFSAFGAASGGEPNATSTSAPSLEEEVRGRYRTADATATSTFSSPPQPTAEHHQAPRTRVSIYSLLNDDDDDEVRPATRDGNDTSFLFASTPASSSSSRSTPTSPVLSSRPPESLVSAGRAARSPPMPRTSSDVEVRSSGRSRSKSAGGRKLLSSSSPSAAQKPAGGGRKRKATNKSATAAAGTGATTSTPSTAGLKYDRRTKKQRQLELLQSVNSGRSVVLSDSLGAEDIAATLASSPLLAYSSSFLPSMLATRARERTTAPTAAEDEEQPYHPPSMEAVNGDDVTAPRPGGSMLPPAPLASYLSAMSSPLPAGAGSPLPLPSSLAQLQQLLPSPLPAGIDQQRVQQLKSQLMPQQQAPSSPTGSSTNTTPGGGGVSSPGANVQSMTNYLNLNININSHHTSRFGDKKRERRDSFSFTYPTRNGDHHQHQQQHHQTVHGPAAAPPSAPLPQHQQEFLQQLLQQIHKKQTVGTPTLPDASPREAVAAASADSSVAVDAGPTSPSLVRFYQRPPHTTLPSLGGALPLSTEADVSVAETSDVPHTEVARSEEDAPLQPMDEQQPPEAEQTHAETDGDEVAVEVEVEIESEPMDVAVQVETALESESESGNNSDNQDTTISSVSNSQESASGAESSTNEMQTDDFECLQRPPLAEVLECGPQEGRTGSIESHQPADGNNSIPVEGEGGLDDPSSSFQGAMSADDVFAGRRKKASPQQMAILEQIWSTTGFRGAFRASTALDFTSSFPSLSSVSASSRNRSSSGSAGASPQLSSSSSSSSSSSPAAVADALLSSRPSPVLLASSSPTLSFAISSPNLPTFLASTSLGHPTRSEPVFHAAGRREDRDDDEREDAGGLTIEDDDDDEEEEPNEREVEALVIASVPCTTLPHLQRSSAILLPASSSSSSSSTYSSPASSSLSSSSSSTYDRATMERSQPGGSAESTSSSSSSSSSPPAVSGEGDDQSRPAPTTAGSDADRCLGSGLVFGAHGSCENGSVGA